MNALCKKARPFFFHFSLFFFIFVLAFPLLSYQALAADIVSASNVSNGTISIDNPNPANGATVKIKLKPNDGYVIHSVSVKDSIAGNVSLTKISDFEYSFKFVRRDAGGGMLNKCYVSAQFVTVAQKDTLEKEEKYQQEIEASKTEFLNTMGSVYNLILSVSYPLAVIGFAIGAFKMITGNQKSMETGQKQMFMVCLAEAALHFIPAVVALGASIGSKYAWTPPT